MLKEQDFVKKEVQVRKQILYENSRRENEQGRNEQK